MNTINAYHLYPSPFLWTMLNLQLCYCARISWECNTLQSKASIAPDILESLLSLLSGSPWSLNISHLDRRFLENSPHRAWCLAIQNSPYVIYIWKPRYARQSFYLSRLQKTGGNPLQLLNVPMPLLLWKEPLFEILLQTYIRQRRRTVEAQRMVNEKEKELR